MSKIFNMTLTRSYICKKIYEALDPKKTSNYAYGLNLLDYEKLNNENAISLIPVATEILGPDTNIARFKLDITVQVFQKYINTNNDISEWLRFNEYNEILDLFLNSYGDIPYYSIDDITEQGSVEHSNAQGRIYEFRFTGYARMINEIDLKEYEKKGGNC